MRKQAVDLPLSPREKTLASEQVGRALFAALQLANEEDRVRRKALQDRQSSTLHIPLPAELLKADSGTLASSAPHATPHDPLASFGFNKSAADPLAWATERALDQGLQQSVHEVGLPQHHLRTEVVTDPSGTSRLQVTPDERIDVPQQPDPVGVLGGTARGLGLAAATGLPALPAGAAGAALGFVNTPGYGGMVHTKDVHDADGNFRQVYEQEKTPGLTAAVKRNIGTAGGSLLGTAVGYKLMRALGHGRIRGGIGAIIGAGGGLALGRGFDKWQKEQALEGVTNSPEQQLQMLADAALRQEQHQGHHKSAEAGILANALQTVVNHPARLMMSSQLGFREAQKDFYERERARIQADLQQAHHEYLNTLREIQHKTAEAQDTPNVDALCNGMAHEAMFGVVKEASHPHGSDVDITEGSLARFAQQILSHAYQPVRPVAETAAAAALGLGGSTAGMTYMLRKRMRENPAQFTEAQLPTRIELTPAML